jgi:hypothetical protein
MIMILKFDIPLTFGFCYLTLVFHYAVSFINDQSLDLGCELFIGEMVHSLPLRQWHCRCRILQEAAIVSALLPFLFQTRMALKGQRLAEPHPRQRV